MKIIGVQIRQCGRRKEDRLAIRRRRKLSKKETKAISKAALSFERPKIVESSVPIEKPVIEVGENIVVRDFASLLRIPVTEVIKVLMKSGVLATINETIDWETAAIVGDELDYEIKLKKEIEKEKVVKEIATPGKLAPRPPIVAVMGHVDHGKTALLDAIRKTNVVSTEAGGITQRIGAYQINFKSKRITFIDTPGHEAFEVMRAHGANITDIVILVVAADEGVKPQTTEAYEHAKKASVPVVVAITKTDLPNANLFKVKQQLSEIGLIPEDMGGKTITVPVSAKQNIGIDDLLEMILLLAEMKNYQASPKKPASAVVVESHLDPQLGPVANLLIQDGTLKEGDFFVVGDTWGKVRLMEDEHKKRLKEVGPSKPVKIAGMKELPSFGEILQGVPDEKTAHQVINDLRKTRLVKGKAKTIFKKEVPIVLKADVLGSLTALKDNLKKLETEEVMINIVRDGVGNITEDDVMMASTTRAKIFGFKVGTSAQAKALAEREKVEVSKYDIIYDLINEIKEIVRILSRKEEEIKVGKSRVLKVFKTTEAEKIIGVKVSSGRIEKGLELRIVRDEQEAGFGKVLSVQIGKESVESVETDNIGGLRISTPTEIKENDVLEFYKRELR